MSDLLICTVCETACCGICQPDVMVDCAGGTGPHCAEHPCRACQQAAADEYREGVQADIALTDCETTT